ncbi:MAG: hypothetical protein HYS61_02145 [Acidobacteria bacterium]|nr:hypothetical protein [Acidobacteriota bacterium]
MANNHSKKQLILDSCEKAQLERIGAREIRAIEAEVRRHLGPSDKVSPSYIANVLRRAGKRVEYNDRFVDPWMEEPYASRLQGVLRFRDLRSAEESLRKLDVLYRQYRETADREGTSLIRSLVLKGKERAKSLASNPRVNPEKRREKEEIAFWFTVWVDNVDLFFDWLEIRKQSEDFKRRFSNHDGRR